MSDIKPNSTASPNQPLLVDIKMVAKLLGRSEQSICRDDERGRIPRPVMLGGSKRWSLKDLRRWVAAGCPSREVWEAALEQICPTILIQAMLGMSLAVPRWARRFEC